TRQLQQAALETYERYRSDDAKAPLPGLPRIAGLDNGKVGVLQNYMDIRAKQAASMAPLPEDQTRLDLERDLEILPKEGKQDEDLERRLNWWRAEGQPNAEKDFPLVTKARLDGGKMALTWTAVVPAAMAVGYLLLILYFMSAGGYKAEVLLGHAADD